MVTVYGACVGANVMYVGMSNFQAFSCVRRSDAWLDLGPFVNTTRKPLVFHLAFRAGSSQKEVHKSFVLTSTMYSQGSPLGGNLRCIDLQLQIAQLFPTSQRTEQNQWFAVVARPSTAVTCTTIPSDYSIAVYEAQLYGGLCTSTW